jgi:tetratricopeptide (TPR) repeat protein
MLVSWAIANDADQCLNGSADERIAACTRAIDSDGLQGNELVAAYGNRGAAYRDKGDSSRAIADLDEAIRLAPQNAEAYRNRGIAHRLNRDLDRAMENQTEAIRIDPNFARAYNARGFAYWAKGDFERAIADYTEAVRLDPSYATAYNNRGNAYAEKGNYDRAITDYDETIRLDPKYGDAYLNRSVVYGLKGDCDHALADCNEAIRLDPNLAIAYYLGGVAKQAKGDDAEGDADIAKAKQLDRTWNSRTSAPSAEKGCERRTDECRLRVKGLNRSRGRVLRGLLGRGPRIGNGRSCLDIDGFRQPHSRQEIIPITRASDRPVASTHDQRPHDPHDCAEPV